jgi:hypothetical protein
MASDFFLPGGILDEEPDEAEEEVGEPASSYSFRFPLQQRSPGAAATRSSSTVAQGWHERISTSGIVPDGALHFRQRTSFYEHNPCLQPAIPQSYAVTSGQSEHASAQPYRRRLQGGIGRLGTLQDASSAALPAAGLGHSTKGRLGSRIPFTGGESLGKRATRSGKAEHAVYGGSVQGGRHASRSREVNDSASRFRPVVASARRRQRSSCPPNKHEFDQEVPQLNRECSSFHKLESPEPQDLVLQKSSSEFAPTTAPGRIRKSAIAEPCEPVEIQAPEVDPVSTLAMMTPEDKASGATVQSGHARSLTCKEGEYKTERGMFADQLLPASAVCALKAQKKCGKGKFRLSSSVDVLDVSNQNSSSNEQDGRGNREELPVMHEAKVEISRAEKLQKGGKLKEKKPKEREMKEDCNLEVKRLPSSSTQRQHQKLGREGKRAWAVRGTLTERATLHLASVSKSIFYYLTIKALQAVKIVVEFVTYIAGRCALVLMSAQELFTFPHMILWLLREGLLIFLCLLGSLTARALAIIVAIVDVHKYAIRELLSNGDLAICFAMPYALRRMAPQLALFGRHWVQVGFEMPSNIPLV